MLLGNKRFARIGAAVVIGVVVVALALSLVSSAVAAPASAPPDVAALGRAFPAAGETPTPGGPASVSSSGDPKPVTRTPQGTSTQVNDKEHLGGLIAFIAFMTGGALLLLRGKRRERRESAAAAGVKARSGGAAMSIL